MRASGGRRTWRSDLVPSGRPFDGCGGARLRAAEPWTGVQPGAGGYRRSPRGAAVGCLPVVVAGGPAGAQLPDLQRVQRGAAAVGEQFDPVAVGVGEDLVGDDPTAAVGEHLD